MPTEDEKNKGNDEVTQSSSGGGVKKTPPPKPASSTVFVGNLTNNSQPVVTPDDPNYQHVPSQPAKPRNAASQKVFDNEAASARRQALWRQHDAEAKARSDKAWETFKENNAKYKAANETRRQGWKEGKFDGMKSIDADTWEALGKRDGGYTTNRSTDENGNLIAIGKNADGTPIFQETYKPNGGSKFDAGKNADAINQLNNWWMKGGGFQSSRGKLPTGVFGKDGKIDVSKIQTQDQFRAIQQVMKAQVTGMNARRDQAYRNLADSQVRDATPRGRDADMQYLLNKGVRIQFDPNTGVRTGITVPGADGKPIQRKWSDQQLAAIAQEYRRNDALGALQGFEESKKNAEGGAADNGDAVTYFDDNGDFEKRDAARIQENLIAAGRAAGLRADQMADDFGNIDSARIRAALGEQTSAQEPVAPAQPREVPVPKTTQEVPVPKSPVDTKAVDDMMAGLADQQFEDIMRTTDELVNMPQNRTEPLEPEVASAEPVREQPVQDPNLVSLKSLSGDPGLDLKAPSIFNGGVDYSGEGSIRDRIVSEIADTIPFVDKIPAVGRAQQRDFNRTVDAYARLNPGVAREDIVAQLQHDKALSGMALSAVGMTGMPVKGVPAVPRTTAVVPRQAPGRVPSRAQLPAPRAQLPAPEVAQLPAPRAQLPAPRAQLPGPRVENAVALRSPELRAEAAVTQGFDFVDPGAIVPSQIRTGRGTASASRTPRLGSQRPAELGYDGTIDAEFTSLPPIRVPGEARVARAVVNSSPAGERRAKPKRRHN